MVDSLESQVSSTARRDARRGEFAGLPAKRGRESPLEIEERVKVKHRGHR